MRSGKYWPGTPKPRTCRTAAYMLAIKKISRAYLEHGVWP